MSGQPGAADGAEVAVERGSWTPGDADNFHWVLSQYTRFEGGKLQLDHRYLDIRDIRMVEDIEDPAKSNKVGDKEIIRLLEAANESNPNKDCRRWFTLLRELQMAAGNKHSIRQINTKHINTRSRWSVPFKSLNEFGYLIKNQTLRGVKRGANSDMKADIQPALSMRRTNVEKKNMAAIKAVRKYIKHREMFWDDEQQGIPDLAAQAAISSAHPEMEDVSEPERWIRAMIRRHGFRMVVYLDQCAVKLTNSYIYELNDQDPTLLHPEIATAEERELMGRILGDMIDEILVKAKAASNQAAVAAAKYAVAAQPPSTKPASLGRRGTPQSRRTVSFSIGADDMLLGTEGTTTPVTPDSTAAYLHHGVSVRVNDSVTPLFGRTPYGHEDDARQILGSLKKSKSHVFGSAVDVPASMPTSIPVSMSLTSLPAFEGVATMANGLAGSHHDEAAASMNSHNGPLYDDGLFTQFVQYEQNAAATNHHNGMLPHSIPGHNTDNLTSTELVDAIINLSVDKNAVPGASQSYSNMQNAVHDQLPPYYNALSQPVSSHHMEGYNQGGPLYLNHDPTIDHQAPGYGSLSRSASDEAAEIPSHIQDPSAELQSILGNKNGAFTFQIPPQYMWPHGSSAQGNVMSTPHASNGLSESFSMPSLASYANTMAEPSTSTQPPQFDYGNIPRLPLAPTNNNNSERSTNPYEPSPLAPTSRQPPSVAGKSQLSTNLIIVNGVPSHIELLHDNKGIHPNPIILPISQILREGD
ncbi:hypothetical protein GGF46_004434 [Coemansia sp. RSA 552]|nr:hypothetical protein GGF46_004434 [Coemansia sp. RSA 552]